MKIANLFTSFATLSLLSEEGDNFECQACRKIKLNIISDYMSDYQMSD